MSEKEYLYVKMLPVDKKAGRTTRDFSITDPTTGKKRKFIAGDPEWYKVNKEFGEILRASNVHFYRAVSPPLFIVCDEQEAADYDKGEQKKRALMRRKSQPSYLKAKSLTGDEKQSAIEKLGIPEISEGVLTETEEMALVIEEQGKQINRLEAMLNSIMSPPEDIVEKEVVEKEEVVVRETTEFSREAALGLVDEVSTVDVDVEVEVEKTPDDFTSIKGIGPSTNKKLHKMGYEIFSDIASADPEVLEEKLEASGSRASKEMVMDWIEQAKVLSE